jgi:lambda family phage portal protein
MTDIHIPAIRSLDLRSEKKVGRMVSIGYPVYAGAKTTRLTGNWRPVDGNVNDVIYGSSPIIRARVRQLIRDFPYFAGATNRMVDYTVGEGIHFQSRVKDGEQLDTRRNQQIEDAFNRWADEADVAGQQHFYEIMRLAKRQEIEAGEFLIIKTRSKKPGRFLPLCLRILEPDWLTNVHDIRYFSAPRAGSEVYQGVEYDSLTGERIAYHLMDPYYGWGNTVRLPADDVIHGYEVLRPGQLRGISPYACGLLLANDLHSIIDAEIDAAKMASKWLAMVTTDSPLGRQLGVGVTTDIDTGKKIEELENAIIEYLRPGEKVELSANPRPGGNFAPFVKLILTMISVTTNIPFELLTADYQGLNFSTAKMVRTDFAQTLRPIARRHIRQFCNPIARAFMDEAVLAGKLDLPGYWSNPWRYWAAMEWQPPGMESIDPMRETKANVDEIKQRLRSPQEIIKSRGRDPEAVVNEIAEFDKLCRTKGISPEWVSTATGNNPSAVSQQG